MDASSKKWAVNSDLINFLIKRFIGKVEKVSGLVITFLSRVTFLQQFWTDVKFNPISI